MSPEKSLANRPQTPIHSTKAHEPQTQSSPLMPLAVFLSHTNTGLVIHTNTEIVISTEAARALCEQRSGEIRFSTTAASSQYCWGITRERSPKGEATYLFFAFSAQKSHVKSQNQPTPYARTTSAWRISSTQLAIMNIDPKNRQAPDILRG